MLDDDAPRQGQTARLRGADEDSSTQDPSDAQQYNADNRAGGSLADDISALIDDGKTYVEAEIAYQKTRLSFVANRSKSGIVFVLAALGLLHLALIGLTVGAIISLIPAVGPLGATLLVVGVLLIAIAILLVLARGKFASLSAAFKDKADD